MHPPSLCADDVWLTLCAQVINIMPYGAFVDIGATTDGLVHVSQVPPPPSSAALARADR